MNTLPWIILLTPLASAAIITLFTRGSRNLSAGISVLASSLAFVLSCVLFGSDSVAPGSINWLNFGESFQVPIGFTIDGLSKLMLLVVTSVGTLVHVYSLGYMKEDDGKSRFFAGLSLFMFSMLGIVLANNLVMMFIFWELVGVSSYILIGHWFQNAAPPAAANKAFITNRLGDFGFMLGILLVWLGTGTILFSELPQKVTQLSPALLTAGTLLLFCGSVGKSAQFPLHVWLPDAMEGPTPVSALIHAATMVAAGVYMLARLFFLVEASPDAQTLITWIGIITAVLAALMATQQDDIKRILAYSTLSQLGYMIMAMGVAADKAAMFHLTTHAFFKALLFLGAGAVIHALHHEQNIWKMGGLKNQMPTTFLTFLVATLALTGFPFLFSGFYSKDAILIAAHERNHLVFYLALGVAFLTAFYMFRLLVVVFFGRPRSDAAIHGHDGPAVMTLPLLILAVPSVIAGFPAIIRPFIQMPAGEHSFFVPGLAIGAFVLGGLTAFKLYSSCEKDPIRIPLFANKFYFDEIYAGLIRYTHDALASLSAWWDRTVIDFLLVRGSAFTAWAAGYTMRFLQVGNLQAYSFLFGLGIVALIYFMLFK